MRRLWTLVLLATAAACGTAEAQSMAGHYAADTLGTPAPVQLPRDDAAHDGYTLEYWQYWTHLKAKDGRRFGAVVTFFNFPMIDGMGDAGVGIRRTDVRVTDHSDDTFHAFSGYSTEPVPTIANGFDLRAAGQTARGGDGRDRIHVAIDDYVLDATLRDTRGPVIYFNGTGVVQTTPFESFRVYGRQRMKTAGVLRRGDERLRVKGSTWFEHGWMNMPTIATINWDYFHLQLEDGRDVQLAQVRRTAHTPVEFWQGQVRDRKGRVRYLGQGDFDIVATGEWRRDATCVYPSGWKIRLGDESFTVTPVQEDQEVRNPVYGHFWDGDTRITGSVDGIGIAEPLNYCVTPVPLPGP